MDVVNGPLRTQDARQSCASTGFRPRPRSEDELKRLGGRFEKVDDWQSLAIVDGHLITGQNPASSEATAKALLGVLSTKA